MTTKTTITCDQCGKDLTSIGDYRIILAAEYSRGPANMTTIETYPWLDHPHHFCGQFCLRSWVVENTRERNATRSPSPGPRKAKGQDSGVGSE